MNEAQRSRERARLAAARNARSRSRTRQPGTRGTGSRPRPAPVPVSAPAPAGIADLLVHGGQEFAAGLLAASTRLGAHPAVLVHLGMPLALVAAALAGGRAGLQQRLGDVGVVLGLAAADPDGGGADVGAVQAQPYALDQLGDVRLAQVVVGVGGAGLGALVDRVD